MKKKYICILLPVILLLALFLLWPHSFPELTAGSEEISIIRVDLTITTGENGLTHPDSTTTSITYGPRTSGAKRVSEIMSSYYFRFCPLKTLLDNGVLEGADAGYWLNIYGGAHMTTGGTGYIMVDGMIYHAGLSGNSENLALMEELSALIPEAAA